ncbi:MAG: rhodanese-like domain-containing protein [Hyphomicrobiaceae bacterium]
MAKSVAELIAGADTVVPRIDKTKAEELISGSNVVVVDVRDAPEVEKSGKIAGAIHVSRGMLEFRADPACKYHDKAFSRDKIYILYCASGGRSALSGKTLLDLGYSNVYNLGAFEEWVKAGGRIEKPIEPGM